MEVPASNISFLIDDIQAQLVQFQRDSHPEMVANISECYVAVIDELLPIPTKSRDFAAARLSLETKLIDLRVRQCFANVRGARPVPLPVLERKILDTVEKIVINGSTNLESLKSMYQRHIEIMRESAATQAAMPRNEEGENPELQQIEPIDFFEACELGNLSFVKQEVKPLWSFQKEALFSRMNQVGCTGLHLAAWRGRVNVLQFLLSEGCSVTLEDKNRYHPLHWAAKIGAVPTAKALINKRAQIEATGEFGRTPLHMAAHNLREEMVALLMDAGANCNAAGTDQEEGVRPLHEAVMKDSILIVALLLSNPLTNVNLTDMLGQSPLYYAVVNGNLMLIAMILRHPTWVLPEDINDPNHFNQLLRLTPLNQAEEVKDFLIRFWDNLHHVNAAQSLDDPHESEALQAAKRYGKEMCQELIRATSSPDFEERAKHILDEIERKTKGSPFPEDLILSHIDRLLIYDPTMPLPLNRRAFVYSHLKQWHALRMQQSIQTMIGLKQSKCISVPFEAPLSGNAFLWACVIGEEFVRKPKLAERFSKGIAEFDLASLELKNQYASVVKKISRQFSERILKSDRTFTQRFLAHLLSKGDTYAQFLPRTQEEKETLWQSGNIPKMTHDGYLELLKAKCPENGTLDSELMADFLKKPIVICSKHGDELGYDYIAGAHYLALPAFPLFILRGESGFDVIQY